MNQDSNNQWSQLVRDAGELSVIGMTLAVATVIGFYLGTLVDKYWPQLEPWGMILGIFLGIAAGFREMFRTVRRVNRRMERENTESKK